jgi:hypothetical protein
MTSFFFTVFIVFLLCVGCRSSRTGTFSASTDTHQYAQTLETHRIDLSSLFDLSLSRSDSFYLRIVKYYPPAPGDTSGRGPLESVTDVVYNAAETSHAETYVYQLTADSLAAVQQGAVRMNETARTTVTHQPFYASWRVLAAAAVILAVIIYIVLKRLKIL